MPRLRSRTLLAALTCTLIAGTSVLAAVGHQVESAPPQVSLSALDRSVAATGDNLYGIVTRRPATSSEATVQSSPAVAAWDAPGLPAQASASPAARSGGVSFPLTSPVNPSFGGFRVAPSTPAHAAGDTSRDLSSAAADFDHDGCKDIVTFQLTNLTVMQGNCKGGFTKRSSQATARSVYHPIAVDVNHDGYPDIVAMTVPFGYLGTVVALVNQQDGTFSAPVVISRKASVYSGLMDMNVYDINGDGNADVIVSGLGTTDAQTNSNLVFEVILGNADGTFGTSTLVETDGVIPYKPTFAFDGGTALRKIGDQLYLYGLLLQSQRVNGTSFASEVLYRWAVSSSGAVDVDHPQITPLPMVSVAPNKYMQFADLDGDGVDDLGLLNGDGMLYTAIGASDGSLGTIQLALPVAAGNNASVLAFRDVDGDGKVDAIMAGQAFLGVWPGNGDGTFRAPNTTYVGGYAANANAGLVFPVSNHVIDDFDGDGIPDIAFFDTVKRALGFHKGKRDGSFVGAAALVNPTGDFQANGLVVLATPDLNGDGYKDIVASSAYGLLGGISDDHGGFRYKILSPLQSISAVSSYCADFNKDGKDDVAFLSRDERGYVHVYLGLSNGDGTVTAVAQPLPFTSFGSPGIAVGDINGDGAPDVVLALNDFVAPSYGLWPMVNDGTGHLTAAPYVDEGTLIFSVALADANGDGAADLFVSHGSYTATTTAVYAATGSGGFAITPSAILQDTMVGGGILASDVTGDGVVDAVVSVPSGTNQGLMLYVGHNDGTFSAGTALVAGVAPSYVGATDLNGDTIPDIYFTTTEGVLTDANDGLMGLVVLRGAGNHAFAPPVSYSIYGASSPVLPIDMFHNGSPSLLAAAGGTATTVLLNNGASTVALRASAASVSSIDAVDVTVTVVPYFPDQPLPTGDVELRVDGTAVSRSAVRSNGTASFSVSRLAVGSHVLSASYAGDSHYNVNLTSNAVTLTVTRATPGFQLTSDAAELSISPGGSTSTAISLAASPAFGGPVTLACEGAPASTTCSFSQSSVMLAPGQTVTSTLTLTASNTAARNVHLPAVAAMLGAAVCGLLLIWPLLRSRPSAGRRMLAVVASVCALGALGCSSDTAATTSPGRYAISVIATPSDTSVPAQTLTVIVVPGS